ncbi:MAG: hypothetical protein WCA38_14565 [Candidatus Acidiferrales bacterium]
MDDGEQVYAEVRQAGADAFVSKTEDPSSLIDAVDRLVGMKTLGYVS